MAGNDDDEVVAEEERDAEIYFEENFKKREILDRSHKSWHQYNRLFGRAGVCVHEEFH